LIWLEESADSQCVEDSQGDEREQDMLPEDNVEAASEAALPGVTIDAVLYFASGGCHGSS
ncbi:hypothetical protein LTR16_006984, partial [Cryomyces antarcticus]